MQKWNYKIAAAHVVAIGLALAGHAAVASGNDSAQEPITFVLPAANFQPIPPDAYPAEDSSAVLTVPEETIGEPMLVEPPSEPPLAEPSPVFEGAPCESCDTCSPWLPEGRLPNGQYPDNWMDRCGGWPYANGPGACDNWKVGPIWDVTADGIVLTREHTNLSALEAAMMEAGDPEVTEQFDRGPGGRVFLTGLLPKNVGYQVMAGYEGIEEWNAAIVYPKEPVDAMDPDGPTRRRSLFYRSSLHSGELNIIRMCNPAWRPYCGVRYIKFDDEIWDQDDEQVLPPLPAAMPLPVIETDMNNIFDIENNLIGFQGGAKYDIWQIGRRLSLQGFVNGGVYYNKAKRSNLMQTTETQYTADIVPDDPMNPFDETSTTVESSNSLSIVEQSEIAFVGEASLTAVCRLNKCWATRVGYQVLWIDGVHLADDAYLGDYLDSRSLIFHGWHAGIECRR